MIIWNGFGFLVTVICATLFLTEFISEWLWNMSLQVLADG